MNKKNMNKKQEQLIQITETLQKGISDVFQSESWLKYLESMSHFHHYTAANTVLIYSQMPEATYVAGYKTWITKFNRHVRHGEKGIRILAPIKRKIDDSDEGYYLLGYRSICVFDISQTVGDPLPQPQIKTLDGEVKNYEILKQCLIEISPARILFDQLGEDIHGMYSAMTNEIIIDDTTSQKQTIKTLIHEITHAILHNENEKNIDRQTKEVEAESVAYTVSSYFGIDVSDYSFGYIAGWSKSKSTDDLHASLQKIVTTSDSLITRIESKIKLIEESASISLVI